MALRRRRILVVEDERSIVGPLAAALEREGFETLVAGTAQEALELGRSGEPDLVLLDLMLPDGSGYDVCRELRSTSEVPIMMLTARGDEADRIVGLELGADDYVVKPFSAREVIARIRAVLRRTSPPAGGPDDGVLEVGAVRLDRGRREATLGGEPLELSQCARRPGKDGASAPKQGAGSTPIAVRAPGGRRARSGGRVRGGGR